MRELSIGEVAVETGISIDSLRYFEHEDLFVHEVARSAGGRRVYSESDVTWLKLCNRFRDSGMPIATIREFAALVRSGPGNEKERLSLLQQHEVLIRSRISAMQDNLAVIHGKVSAYERHVREGTVVGVWEHGPRPE